MFNDHFYLNGLRWNVIFVDYDSEYLIDRTNTYTVATTDPRTQCIYLSKDLRSDFLTRVFIHELGHCAIFSFNLLHDIHRMVKPEYWMEAEEWVCNFIADYGIYIFSIARSILGDYAIDIIPSQIEKFIA